MRWHRLARKNVRDAMRSWSLYGVVGLFLVLGGTVGYLAGGADSSAGSVVFPLTVRLMTFLVPVVALGLTYESVAGPRTSGSLQFLLALPYDRRDVVVGTYAGRLAVLGAAVCVGYLMLAASMLLRGVPVPPLALLTVLGLVLLLAAAFVAIGVGLSTAARSTTVAGGLAFLVFFLFFLVWGSVPGIVAFVLNGFSPPASQPSWAPPFRALNPLAAFQAVAAATVSAGGTIPAAPGPETVRSLPLSVAVLAGWTLLTPLAGYLRFRDDDL